MAVAEGIFEVVVVILAEVTVAFGRDSGGGRGCSSRGGRGRSGCTLRYCTYYHGENHIIEFCWDLHDRPSASAH